MARTMTYLISRSDAHESNVNWGLIGSALLSTMFLGGLITTLVFIAMPYFVKYWLETDKNLLQETILAFRISTLVILPGLISNVFKGILEGNSQFKEANICKIFSGASVFIAPLIVISFISKSLIDISISIVVSRYLALILYVIYSISPSKIFQLKVNRESLSAIWSYGVWAAISGFISTTFVYGDRFIVAGYLEAQDLAIYIASQDILNRYLLIPWSMAIVLMPTFSSDSYIKSKVVELYQLQQKRVGLISFFLLLLVLIFFIWLTLQTNYLVIPENAKFIVAIQIVGIFFCALSQLPLIYLYGKGRPKLVTKIFVAELFIYVVLAPFVFNFFGVIGASLIWSGRLIIEYFLLRHYAERLIFEKSLSNI